MVKPDGVQRGLIGEVLNRIERRGLKIVAMRMNTMSLDSAKKHYAEHAQKPFFNSLISFITSGPSVSMVVEGKNAIYCDACGQWGDQPGKCCYRKHPRGSGPGYRTQHCPCK